MYIKLYADEFPSDVWEEYCTILEVSPSAECVKITVKDAEECEEEICLLKQDLNMI